MLKGSQTIAFALTLTSLFVGISTNIAYAKQNAQDGTYVNNEPSPERRPKRCFKNGVVIPCAYRPAPPISITNLELNNVTNDVAIKKLEALKASGQASSDDYILLGYFYGLENKYDQSKANYLTALKLATNNARKNIIQQELKKLRAATSEVKPVEK